MARRLSGLDESEPVFDTASLNQVLTQMTVDSYNASAGTLTGYECAKCRNRGNYAFISDRGTLTFKDCSCVVTRKCISRMESSGLKNVIRDFTFDRYQTLEEWQIIAKQTAEDYANNPEGWLLLCGQSGSGKSHLCTAVARALLLSGREVVYMPWRDEVTRIKGISAGEARAQAVDKLKKSDVLYIDDLFKSGRAADGATNPTVADINLVFELLNYRVLNQLATIISTEKYPEELAEIDEAVGGRIIERSGDHIICITRDIGKNYRLKSVKRV